MITAKKKQRKLSSSSRSNPFLDSESIIRVDESLGNSSSLDWRTKHPIILPKNHPVTVLVIFHLIKWFITVVAMQL